MTGTAPVSPPRVLRLVSPRGAVHGTVLLGAGVAAVAVAAAHGDRSAVAIGVVAAAAVAATVIARRTEAPRRRPSPPPATAVRTGMRWAVMSGIGRALFAVVGGGLGVRLLDELMRRELAGCAVLGSLAGLGAALLVDAGRVRRWERRHGGRLLDGQPTRSPDRRDRTRRRLARLADTVAPLESVHSLLPSATEPGREGESG